MSNKCIDVYIAGFNPNIINRHINDNIPLDTKPSFDIETTYGEYEKVKYDSKIWESASASNQGNTPSLGSRFWEYDGEANEVRYLNAKRSERSENSSTTENMTLEYNISGAGYIVLGGLIGESCNIKITNIAETEIYLNETIPLGAYWAIMNDFDWLYPYNIAYGETKYFKQLEIRYDQKVTIAISPSTEGTGIGLFNFGRLEIIGQLMYGLSFSRSPSETVKRDIEENIYTEPKNGKKRMSYPLSIRESGSEAQDYKKIKDILDRYAGVAISLVTSLDGASSFGIYRDLELSLDSMEFNTYNIVVDLLE